MLEAGPPPQQQLHPQTQNQGEGKEGSETTRYLHLSIFRQIYLASKIRETFKEEVVGYVGSHSFISFAWGVGVKGFAE